MKPAINSPNFGNYHHETLAPWIDAGARLRRPTAGQIVDLYHRAW